MATSTKLESKFRIRRVPLNNGGYDRTGQYYGIGAPLWEYEADVCEQVVAGRCVYCDCSQPVVFDRPCAWSRDDEHRFPMKDSHETISDRVRASCRDEVKALILKKYPDAEFYR
jgi:hypothetical protein